MNAVNKIVCEHSLPVPFEKFSEDEKNFFEKVEWNEEEFYTTSFYEESDEGSFFSYSISEDGQFYAEKTIISHEEDDKGSFSIKEKDGGVEKRDFTGEIFLGTEFLGEVNEGLDDDHDYTFYFAALFFKGDLKELKLHEFGKNSNEHRKKIMEEVAKRVERTSEIGKSILYKVVHYLFILPAWLFILPYKLLGKIIVLISKLELKIKSKIIK